VGVGWKQRRMNLAMNSDLRPLAKFVAEGHLPPIQTQATARNKIIHERLHLPFPF
jgi:hypothetical protein